MECQDSFPGAIQLITADQQLATGLLEFKAIFPERTGRLSATRVTTKSRPPFPAFLAAPFSAGDPTLFFRPHQIQAHAISGPGPRLLTRPGPPHNPRFSPVT